MGSSSKYSYVKVTSRRDCEYVTLGPFAPQGHWILIYKGWGWGQ